MHLNAVSAYFILSPSELHLRGIFSQKYMVDSVSLRMVKLLFEFNNHKNFFSWKDPAQVSTIAVGMKSVCRVKL